VTLSNSLLILTPCHPAEFDISDSDASNTLVVRDSVQQILECIPTVPKLDRLDALLRNAIYDPDADTEDFIPDLDAAGPDVEMSDIPNPVNPSSIKLQHSISILFPI
jgi:sister chromatid cohesion protein DCC1